MEPTPEACEKLAQAIADKETLNYVGFLGGGAFKRTYLVEKDGVKLALKVFFGSVSSERDAREIDVLRRLSYCSISKFHSSQSTQIEDKNYLWVLEEYLDGGTLGQKLNGVQLPIIDAKEMWKILIDSVAYVKNQNLVHRDIKPENIMFRSAEPEKPVLVDFGLVRDLSQPSLTTSWAMQGPGTPFFAPPEQLNNEKLLIDWRSDQFSLGVVFALAVFGVHPYAVNDNPHATVDRVSKRIGPTSAFNKLAIDNGCEALLKMIEPWPNGRFRKPTELLRVW